MALIVTLAEAKAYLGIEHADDDTRLGAICTRVTGDIETYTRRSFQGVTAGAVAYVDGGGAALIMPGEPITEVASIEDAAASNEAVDPAEIEIAEAGLIYRRQSGARVCWPGRNRDSRYKVKYSHGYATPPAAVKGAAYDMVASRYERPDITETSRSESGLAVTYGPLWETLKAQLKPFRSQVL